jgi:hypothetical protein
MALTPAAAAANGPHGNSLTKRIPFLPILDVCRRVPPQKTLWMRCSTPRFARKFLSLEMLALLPSARRGFKGTILRFSAWSPFQRENYLIQSAIGKCASTEPSGSAAGVSRPAPSCGNSQKFASATTLPRAPNPSVNMLVVHPSGFQVRRQPMRPSSRSAFRNLRFSICNPQLPASNSPSLPSLSVSV